MRREVSFVRLPTDEDVEATETWLQRAATAVGAAPLPSGSRPTREEGEATAAARMSAAMTIVEGRRGLGPRLVGLGRIGALAYDATFDAGSAALGHGHPRVLRGIYEGPLLSRITGQGDRRAWWAARDRLTSTLVRSGLPRGLPVRLVPSLRVALRREAELGVLRERAGSSGGMGAGGVGVVDAKVSVPEAARAGVIVRLRVGADVAQRLGAVDASTALLVLRHDARRGVSIEQSRADLRACAEVAATRRIPWILDASDGAPDEVVWKTLAMRLGFDAADVAMPPRVVILPRAIGIGVIVGLPPTEDASARVPLAGLTMASILVEERSQATGHAEEVAEVATRHGLVPAPAGSGVRTALWGDVLSIAGVDAPRGDGDETAPSVIDRIVTACAARGLLVERVAEDRVCVVFGLGFSRADLDLSAAILADALHDRGAPPAKPRRAEVSDGVVIRRLGDADWDRVLEIERSVYEPERSDPEWFLRDVAARGLALVATDRDTGDILGFTFGGPLELFSDRGGPDRDPWLGTGTVFYSADITVAPHARGRGVGKLLKVRQIDEARARGFRWITGRNKVGATDVMQAINRSYGAYLLYRVEGIYDGTGAADYYRMPLVDTSERAFVVARDATDGGLGSGVSSVLDPGSNALAGEDWIAVASSALDLGHRLSVRSIRALEVLRAVLPDELTRLRVHAAREDAWRELLAAVVKVRPQARQVLVLGGSTALDDHGVDGELVVARVVVTDVAAKREAADSMLDAALGVYAAGATSLAALVIEPVDAVTGVVWSDDMLDALRRWASRHGVPVLADLRACGPLRDTSPEDRWPSLPWLVEGAGRGGAEPWVSEDAAAKAAEGGFVWAAEGGVVIVATTHGLQEGLPDGLAPRHTLAEPGLLRVAAALVARLDRPVETLEVALGRTATVVARALVSGAIEGTAPVVVRGRGLWRALAGDPSRIRAFVFAAARHGVELELSSAGVAILAPTIDVDPEHLDARVMPRLAMAAEEVAGG